MLSVTGSFTCTVITAGANLKSGEAVISVGEALANDVLAKSAAALASSMAETRRVRFMKDVVAREWERVITRWRMRQLLHKTIIACFRAEPATVR